MKRFAILLALSLTGAFASAQTSTTTAPVDDSAAAANATTGTISDLQKSDEQLKDHSKEITNARMRAEAGSNSKWSMKANLSYSGGSIERPAHRERPNYRSGAVGAETVTSLGGTLGLAYRAADKLTVRAGTGLSMRTPFHNKDRDILNNQYENSDRKVIDIATPYLELSSAFRTGNFMVLPSASLSYYSRQFDREFLKQDMDLSLSLTTVMDIPGSGWQPGFSVIAGNTFFTDDRMVVLTSANGPIDRADYYAGFYPFVEYQFNDRYSFRTLVGFTASHYRQNDAQTFESDKIYQSMGVGIAMTKEIYFYPNVQFLPENIRGDLTNVGISTTMSVF